MAPIAGGLAAARRDRALRSLQSLAQRTVRRAVLSVAGGPNGKLALQFAPRACHQGFTILTIIPNCAHGPLPLAGRRVAARFFSGPTYGVMPACK